MANCGRVIYSRLDQNCAEDSAAAKLEHTNSVLGSNGPSTTPSAADFPSTTSQFPSSSYLPRTLTVHPPLISASNSMCTHNTWASSTDAHVHPSLPTPPYTPQTTLPAFSSMAGQFEPNGELTEENNNMDENSNDQQYEQYSHFHHQHYLEQQAQDLREREQNVTVAGGHQEYMNGHPQFLEGRRNEACRERTPPVQQIIAQNHLPEPVRNSSMQMHNFGNEVNEQRSVRPRVTGTGVAHRRMSLNPQQGMCSSELIQESTLPLSQNSTTALVSGDQASEHDGQVSFFVNNRRGSNRGHQRRRSCDSGIAHLLRQDNSLDERDNVQGLPTLPRPPRPSATAENSSYLHQYRAEDGELPRSCTATEREAQMLLYNFTREEISREHLAVPQDIARVQGLEEYNLIRAGTELRRLADAFAATPARSKVRIMAQDVLVSEITWENFTSLCMLLFSEPRGITAERIVALFTFIADVAKEQIRRGAESCIRQLMTWSLRFIFQRVCQWVDSAGGWGRVLQQGLDVVYKVAVSVLAGVAVIAMAAYISRTWRS
ncbi:Blc2 family [Trinorchestia longiramus]|nr:Blc2 family [Trinorchestia longiramus]